MTDKKITNAELNIEISTLNRRVSSLEKEVESLKPLQVNTLLLQQQCKQIQDTLDEVKGDVKAMKQSPANFLDKVITAIVSSVVGGVVVFLFSIFHRG